MNVAATNNPASDVEDGIQKFINMINSNQKPVQFEGLVSIRKLISIDDNPPIQKVIASGVVPKLLEIMAWEDESTFQVESTWCIINICSGDSKFCDYILQLGGLDIIIDLLNSKVDEVVDHSIWAICNIAGSCTKNRDICLEKDCLKKFLKTLEQFPAHNHIQNNAMLGISNLCQGKPVPDWQIILPALPVLHKYISDVQSQETLGSALWSLSYISEDNIQEVVDQGCVPFLVKHLCEGSQEILAPILRTVGNILSGSDKQANELLSHPEFLLKLFETTTHPKKVFKKEVFWAISNIAAGTPEQIEMLIKDEYIERLKNAVALEEFEIGKEASYAICNMVSSGTAEQVDCLIKEHDLMESFVHIFQKFDNSLKEEAIDAILSVLQNGSCDPEIICNKIEEAGLVGVIKDLPDKDDFGIKADLILEYFFDDDAKEEQNVNQDHSERED